MRHDRLSVLTALETQGVVPVFYHPDPEVCLNVIRACARGGAPVAKEFARTDPDIILGVGSIVDAPTAALFIASAARFIVSPALNPEVARLCNRRMIPYSPGCGSVTEISYAQELGCEIVKLFPGSSVGGAEFVKAIMGPMPWTKIMPTGGVDPDAASIAKWFGSGIVAAGMGSKLITGEAIKAKDWSGIEAQVRQTVDAIAAFRAG